MPGEWGGTAAVYEASFGTLCAGAITAVLDAVSAASTFAPPSAPSAPAAPAGGGSNARTLLDVGTGPGALAREAAERGFTVDACDPEPSMIELARGRGGAVAYRLAGLPELPYPDGAFDVVCANFVLNHTLQPRDAARELARVCRGAAAVTVWPRMRTVLNGLWSGVVRDAAASTPEGVLLPPEDDFERSEAGVGDLLAGAGFREVHAHTLEWDFAIGADLLWTAVEAGVATIGTTYAAQDDAGRARMRGAYLARAADLESSDGRLHFPTFALLAVGTIGDAARDGFPAGGAEPSRRQRNRRAARDAGASPD